MDLNKSITKTGLAAGLSLLFAVGLATPNLGGQEKKGEKGQQQAPTPEQQEKMAEQKDFAAIQNELDPDRQIQLAEDFAKKHPNSQLLSYAYAFAAAASQQKGNIDGVIDYGEKSVKLKPDNLMALLILSGVLPQPQALRSAADKDKRLAEAETDATEALKIIDSAPNDQLKKLANETDDQFAKRKTTLGGEPHSALGMVHLQRASEGSTGPDKAELGKAEEEYRKAVSATDRPNAQDYYRLGEALSLDGKIDDSIAAFSKCSELSQGSPLQTYADQKVQELKKRKAGTQPPAKQ